jgi:hypothetical protein
MALVEVSRSNCLSAQSSERLRSYGSALKTGFELDELGPDRSFPTQYETRRTAAQSQGRSGRVNACSDQCEDDVLDRHEFSNAPGSRRPQGCYLPGESCN